MAVTFAPLLTPASAENVLDPEAWPRSYKVGDTEFAIYQPQIVEWSGYRHLKANAAIAVKLEGQEEATFGTTSFEADTVADFDAQSVRIGTRTFGEFSFPELDAANAAKATGLVRSVLTPDSLLDIPMASMVAAADRADGKGLETAVNLDPPPIFYSAKPAVLVVFLGEPKLEPVKAGDPSLMFAVNTNWDLLFDSDSASYYLLAGNEWLRTNDLAKGEWSSPKALPASFDQLPDDANWSDVKARLVVLPGVAAVPEVFVSYEPAEIILTWGAAQFSPVSGTRLMYVVNTEDELFFDPADKSYYFLTSGRWFKAAALEGPWSAASESLPEEFRSIPGWHPKSNVLVSVAGTPEADEAVIRASIPQTATVDRSSATVMVSYDGDPEFEPVEGADDVQFAVNTGEDVFLVSNQYYCCYQGVWFQAPAATGPWLVCDDVPNAIYSIPPESPKYNVTQVYVYDSTPTTVQVGVTSGYSGSYVAGGVVMFGLGLWAAHEWAHNHYYPSPCWYGYGCGAYYRPGTGYCRRGGYCYGPYGGAGYAAAYNPATGGYARAGYAYGPRGAVAGKAAYNPWTNTTAGRVGGTTPYGSWGRSAVVRDDQWARTAHRSNWQGSVRGVENSKGGAAVRVDRRFGNDGFLGKTGNDDVYAGRNGNLYRKTDDGWQKRQDGDWQNAPDVPNRPEPRTRPTEPRTRPVDPPARPTEPRTRPAEPRRTPTTIQPAPSNYQRRSAPSQLNRDSYSRQRSRSSRSSGGRSRRR
jgi:hypothetical protein